MLRPTDPALAGAGTAVVTVSDVLTLDEVQAGSPKVLAGHEYLDRPVRWVHIAEVPDIAKLLKGGELLLATGIAFPDDAAGLTSYVDELAEAGASGLVVELVRRYHVMPPALVAAASRAKLPLVALEREVRFVAITEAVHAKIMSAQLADLRVEERVHRAFHALAVRATPGEVVRKMSELAHCPVVFENIAHRPLAVANYSVPLEELLSGWEDRSRHLDNDHPGWFATAVEARSQPCGRVVMLLDRPPSPLHRCVLDSGADALAVAWLVTGPPSSLEHAAQRELLQDIGSGRCQSMNEVYVRSRALGVPLRHQYLAVMCVTSTHPFCSEEAVSRALARSRSVGITGRLRDDQVFAVFTIPPGEARERQLAAIAADVRGAMTADQVSLAFGVAFLPEHPELDDLPRAMAKAEEAAQSILGSGDERVVTVDDIDLRGLLRLLANDPRVQRFASRELRRLWEHDERYGTHLLDILVAYLESGGNKSVAAARLHLSRAAFYNSLDRIACILERDLEEPEVRTALHVAVLASPGDPPHGTQVEHLRTGLGTSGSWLGPRGAGQLPPKRPLRPNGSTGQHLRQ